MTLPNRDQSPERQPGAPSPNPMPGLVVAIACGVAAYYLTGPVEAVHVFVAVLAFLRGIRGPR